MGILCHQAPSPFFYAVQRHGVRQVLHVSAEQAGGMAAGAPWGEAADMIADAALFLHSLSNIGGFKLLV
jgi:hypothetical protein